MGIGKSRGTSPINVNDMLEKVEINQQIESEKQEIDKLLIEIREAKETLIKFNEDLEKAIAAECRIEGALKAAAGSCENIVRGICNAIVKVERDTKFKTTITPEQLTKLRQLIDHSIESWISVLANHRAEQAKLIAEHESNMRKIIRRNEGVWFSDFWMKVLVIFLIVYTVGLGLVVYCVT
jgi:ribosomal protein S13